MVYGNGNGVWKWSMAGSESQTNFQDGSLMN